MNWRCAGGQGDQEEAQYERLLQVAATHQHHPEISRNQQESDPPGGVKAQLGVGLFRVATFIGTSEKPVIAAECNAAQSPVGISVRFHGRRGDTAPSAMT